MVNMQYDLVDLNSLIIKEALLILVDQALDNNDRELFSKLVNEMKKLDTHKL